MMVFCPGLTDTGVNVPVVLWETTGRQRFRRVKQHVTIFYYYPYLKDVWISVILNPLIRGRN